MSRFGRRGAVAATTLAPVGVRRQRWIAHRRAMADPTAVAVVRQPQQRSTVTTDQRDQREGEQRPREARRTGSTNNGATAGPMIVPRPNDEDSADSAATRPLRRVFDAR